MDELIIDVNFILDILEHYEIEGGFTGNAVGVQHKECGNWIEDTKDNNTTLFDRHHVTYFIGEILKHEKECRSDLGE